jgi:hypothetical protein
MENRSPMLLTKSRYLAGTQCLKRLYLTVHDPKLAWEPDNSAEAIIEQGHEVGNLARQMFPGGAVVESRGRDEAIRVKRELVETP